MKYISTRELSGSRGCRGHQDRNGTYRWFICSRGIPVFSGGDPGDGRKEYQRLPFISWKSI